MIHQFTPVMSSVVETSLKRTVSVYMYIVPLKLNEVAQIICQYSECRSKNDKTFKKEKNFVKEKAKPAFGCCVMEFCY